MTRFVTTCLTTTILTAVPALAQNPESDMPALCEQGFIPADTNEDAQLSADEIDAQRSAEFAALDTNDDGSIDRAEYVACIGKAEKSAQDAAAKMEEQSENVATWDDVETADQSLTAEDFMALAEEAWEDSPAAAKKVFTYNEWLESEEQFARSAVNRFMMQDKDNDGVLTKEEYETRARERQWSEDAVVARFNSLDADGSGTISPQEYAAAGTRTAAPGMTQTEGSESADAQTDRVVVPVYVYYMYAI